MVRNPIGVLSANSELVERAGADPDAVASMREQIQRAAHFVDELLRYGRPRPLEIRPVELDSTIELAFSTARQGLGEAAPEVDLEKRLADDARFELTFPRRQAVLAAASEAARASS